MNTDTKTVKWTRSEYLDKVCTHREYWAQFVTPYIKRLVETRFGSRLLSSRDPHFNDIPLDEWDRINTPSLFAIDENGDGKRFYSLSNGTCIMKEAATQIVEEAAKS